MSSPFPGFDPYLELPDTWPDLHIGLVTEISAHLNLTLPMPYYARLDAFESTVAVEPIRHAFVEIRDSAHRHKLVTLIEIASPSNKRPGQDRRAYQQKQREVLEATPISSKSICCGAVNDYY
jgi:hypothetical protein